MAARRIADRRFVRLVAETVLAPSERESLAKAFEVASGRPGLVETRSL